MAMVVDSDTQFYPSGLYDRCESKDLKIIRNPRCWRILYGS